MVEHQPDNRPPVYTENGAWVYRASSLGHCLRALMAARQGMLPEPLPAWMYEKFAQGTEAEPKLLDRFYSDHSDWVSTGEAQTERDLAVGDRVIVRCHLDDLAVNETAGELAVIEAKAVGDTIWRSIEQHGTSGLPTPYPWQLAVYMHQADARHGCWVVGHKNDDGSFDESSEIRYLWVHEPPYTLDDINGRVAEVEAWAAGEKGEGWPECPGEYVCGYRYLHDAPEWVKVTGEDRELVEHAAKLYADGSKLEQLGKGKKREAQRIIENWVGRLREWAEAAPNGDVWGSDDDQPLRVETPSIRVTWIEEDVPPQTIERKGFRKSFAKFTARKKR